MHSCNRDEMSGMMKMIPQMHLKTMKLNTDEVSGGPDEIVETGNYEMDDSTKTVDKGNYVVVWKKDGDKWKIFRDIWNSSVMPGYEMRRILFIWVLLLLAAGRRPGPGRRGSLWRETLREEKPIPVKPFAGGRPVRGGFRLPDQGLSPGHAYPGHDDACPSSRSCKCCMKVASTP
jgi:hypothetical protein